MQLVDAIEAWGRAHRAEFDADETQAVADVWRTVRSSEHASIDVTTMAKDEARAVMARFAAEDRSSVAAMLNKVRKWTIAQADPVSADAVSAGPAPVDPAPAEGAPADGALADEARAGDAAAERAEPSAIEHDPDAPPVAAAAADDDMVMIDGSSLGPSAQETIRGSGPVEGWQPPSGVDDPPMAIDQRIILGLLGLVLAVVLVWFLFLRDDAGDAAPVDGSPDAVQDIVSITNQEFLRQFELTPEVDQCLIDEFGDLAAAATDATLRARQVCGTSLLAIITEGS